MTIYAVQNAFQGLSGLAEDRYVNTFHVASIPSPGVIDFAGVANAIRHFYNPATGTSPKNYMSNQADGGGRTIKIYDLTDSKPRTPVHEETDLAPPWTQSAVQQLPSEVAVCLSYRAVNLSGVPAARRRGRIYIGPLAVNAMTTSLTAKCRVLPAFQGELTTAAQRLQNDLEAAGAVWIVYSPTNDPTEEGVPGSGAAITNVWVDDAFDTQRRRGEAPSSRLSVLLT